MGLACFSWFPLDLAIPRAVYPGPPWAVHVPLVLVRTGIIQNTSETANTETLSPDPQNSVEQRQGIVGVPSRLGVTD